MSWPAGDVRIKHRPGVPLYELVLVRLTEALFADPPPGDKLPPEPELCERFAVSRTTLRRALDDLEARGVVVRRQGLGTFFVGGNPSPTIPDLMSSMEVLQAVPGFTSRCLTFGTIQADQRLADIFGFGEGNRLLHVKRLDRVGQLPVALVDVYVRDSLLSDVSAGDVERSSVYSLLERSGYPVTHATQFVYADVWGKDDAAHMGVGAGQAALVLERTTYSRTDEPIEFALMRFTQRTIRIEMELLRASGSTSIRLTASELTLPEPA